MKPCLLDKRISKTSRSDALRTSLFYLRKSYSRIPNLPNIPKNLSPSNESQKAGAQMKNQLSKTFRRIYLP